MFLVDASVFVHAAVAESPYQGRARTAVEEWRRGRDPWFATWPILYEVMRTLTHPAVYSRPASPADAYLFVERLLDAPSFAVLEESPRHPAIAREVVTENPWAAGAVMHDLHTAVLMREHGVREIRTADTDFLKFGFLRVTNPLLEDS